MKGGKGPKKRDAQYWRDYRKKRRKQRELEASTQYAQLLDLRSLQQQAYELPVLQQSALDAEQGATTAFGQHDQSAQDTASRLQSNGSKQGTQNLLGRLVQGSPAGVGPEANSGTTPLQPASPAPAPAPAPAAVDQDASSVLDDFKKPSGLVTGSPAYDRIQQLLTALCIERLVSTKEALVEELSRLLDVEALPPSMAHVETCAHCATSLHKNLTCYVLDPLDEPNTDVPVHDGRATDVPMSSKARTAKPHPQVVLCATCFHVANDSSDDHLPNHLSSVSLGRKQAVEYRMLSKQQMEQLREVTRAVEHLEVPEYSTVWQVPPSTFAVPEWKNVAEPAMSAVDLEALLSMLNSEHLLNMLHTYCSYRGGLEAASSLARQVAPAITGPPDRTLKDHLEIGRKNFQCNPDDSRRTAVAEGGWSPGIVALDDRITAAVTAPDLEPSKQSSIAAELAATCQQQLQAAAEQAHSSGQHGIAKALVFWCWVIGLRYSQKSGQLLNLHLMSQTLLLIGCAQTWTPGHIDVAAALTYLVPLLLDGMPLKEVLKHPLAKWLHLSPRVFADKVLLKRLLSLLVAQKGRRHLQQQLHRKQQSKCQQQQQQQQHRVKLSARQQQLQIQAKAAEDAAIAASHELQYEEPCDSFTTEEQRVLQLLSTKQWRLTGAEMDEVKGVLGDDAVVSYQMAFQGVDVRPGFMHFVCNLRPCLKVAFERLAVEDIASILHMQLRLRNRMGNLPADYAHPVTHVVSELLTWHPFLTSD